MCPGGRIPLTRGRTYGSALTARNGLRCTRSPWGEVRAKWGRDGNTHYLNGRRQSNRTAANAAVLRKGHYMAAKAHLRNNKPLLISISTNDALGMNMKNIGLLLNAKNIYFIPFGQDNPQKKPNSMIAHTEFLIPALEAALEGRQYQPVIL